MFFSALPLVGIVIIIYNIIAFAGAALVSNWAGMDQFLVSKVLTIPMVRGVWTLRWTDVILAIALIALFLEIIRATNIGRVAIMNHAFSMTAFVVAVIEFLIVDGFATSTFFLITLMALIDVIGGFTIGIISARRDIGLADNVADKL